MSGKSTGKITQIYVQPDGCFVSLDATPKPKDNLYLLKTNHDNYNSLYSLIIAAAVNRYAITLRTQGDVNEGEHAVIVYGVVTW